MRDAKLDRLFLRFRDRGDVRALSRLFDLTSRELLEVAAHVTHDAAQAEDLLQATFLIAIERAQRYDGSRRVMPWLVGIMTREATLWNRHAARRIEIDRLASSEPPDPSAEVESRELSTALVDAIEKLPELYRDVLVRHLRDGRSAGEIARELDRSPGTVRVQIHRALELLRQSLPVGLVAGGIAAMAPRGLAAVRAEVVRSASVAARPIAAASAAGATWTVLGGGIVLKKTIVTIAALVLALIAWWKWPSTILEKGATNRGLGASSSELSEARATSTELEGAVERHDRAPQQDAEATNAAPVEAFGSLLVKVTWREDGTPAADVCVEIDVESAPYEPKRSMDLMTNKDGIVRVPRIEAGSCEIELDRGNDRWTDTRVTVELAKETKVELSVPPGVGVDGVVVDEHGSPVADASVWLSKLHQYPGGRIVARTTADGTFHLRAVTRGQSIGACAQRRAPSDLVYLQGSDVFANKARVTLELDRPGHLVRGIVRDSRGVPLSGARVSIGRGIDAKYFPDSGGIESTMRELPDGSRRFAAQPLDALTDSEGRFEIDGVEIGDVPALVWAKDATPWHGQVHVELDAPARLDVNLPEPAEISGVVRSQDGSPVAKLYVEAAGPTLGLFASTRTDENGAYRLTGVPLGEIDVRANRQRFGKLGSASTKLDVVAGSRITWNPTLSVGSSISGRLLDESGSPLASWPGTAHRGATLFDDLYAATDADGKFTFTGCLDSTYTIEFHPPRAGAEAMPSAWKKDVRAGSADVEVRATAATRASCRLRGRLVDASGSVLRAARLVLDFAEVPHPLLKDIESSDGSFELGPLPPGGYVLSVAPLGAPAQTELGRYEIAPGQALDAGDLVVR
jgi:RNA polymerase sigma-70 factor (ECF subfamily)